MGSNKHTKIGPFLLVEGTVNKIEIDVVRVCTNPVCLEKDKETKSKFCGSCGRLIDNVDIERVEKLDVRRLLWSSPEFAEEFYFPAYADDAILSNYEPPFGKGGNGSTVGWLDLTKVDIDAEIKWFKETHAAALTFLEEKFGKENVYLKWGAVTYWS